jgi:hypothetical protein
MVTSRGGYSSEYSSIRSGDIEGSHCFRVTIPAPLVIHWPRTGSVENAVYKGQEGQDRKGI